MCKYTKRGENYEKIFNMDFGVESNERKYSKCVRTII